MKEGTTRTVVDESFVQFFNSFHSIAEKTSGTLALAIIQCLVMVAAVVKKKPGAWGNVLGLNICCLSFYAGILCMLSFHN